MSTLEVKKLACGQTVEYLPDEENEKYRKLFLGQGNMVKLNPAGLFMAERFLNFADKYYQFQFRPSDVLLMTFPKCGTTWSQEIVWTMINNRNLDKSEGAEGINIRVPFLEADCVISSAELHSPKGEGDVMDYFRMLCPGKTEADGVFLQISASLPSPRVMKTHLPFSFLDPNLLNTCRVIFVARDPKDTCVSFHHHCRLTMSNNYVGTMEQFLNYFVADKLCSCPFWGMIKEGWERRNHPNMLFLYYEDMKADTMKALSSIDKFLQTNLSEDQISNICKYTSFESMKKRNNLVTKHDENLPGFNDKVIKEEGGFFRKGIVGDSKNALTKEQLQILDDWTAKNTADMPGLKYAPS